MIMIAITIHFVSPNFENQTTAVEYDDEDVYIHRILKIECFIKHYNSFTNHTLIS